ncbi:glycosyltransferase [Brevibacterium sp. Marseille-P9724]|uniref:glycosyltransferase n=1 Tax=Brevibacterium sp. Marseille-P9724 TaxID=2614125 RepID=UPI00125F0A1D|nr:glycosyltransferase [Brevibacterium sp. Marseille-P9724]
MNSSLPRRVRRIIPALLRSEPKGILPAGNYYTMLWAIPETFGGMTSVALERSSAFARRDNRPVEILTFSRDNSGKERERALKAEGRLDKRVSLRNVWEDLSQWSDDELARMKGTAQPVPEAVDDALPRTSGEAREQRTDDVGTVLQTDHYSAQGNLLVIDRQDTKTRGTKGGRLLTLLNSQGEIIGQWRTATAFYKAWLNAVFGNKPSYVIVDSSYAGSLFSTYRKKNVIFCTAMHSNFLENHKTDARRLIRGKFKILRNLDRFDRAITLTHAQQRDMLEHHLSSGNLTVMPNLIRNLKGNPKKPRTKTHGLMLARLTKGKRIDHAIRAVTAACASAPGLQLEICGDGDMHSKLAQQIDANSGGGHITLRGYVSNAKEHFHDASFSLLTSTQEGQPLVILESMSAGCIPIAYDIKYGPSDIITDGVDGFLVPDGDIEALTQAIIRIATMDDAELTTMRRNAIKRAQDFYEATIVEKWAAMFRGCSFDPFQRSQAIANLTSLTVTDTGVAIEASVEDHPWEQTAHTYVSWCLTGTTYYGRTPADFDGATLRAHIPLSELRLLPAGTLELSADFADGRSFRRTRILADEPPTAAGSFFTSALDDEGQLSLQISKH